MLTTVYEAAWPTAKVRVRALTWKEFHQAKGMNAPVATRNLWVYQTVLLEGPRVDQVSAGIVAWVGRNLVEDNPFGGDAKTLQKYLQLSRQWLQNSYLENAKALVAGTFHYRFEEIESWDHEKFFRRLAAAEFLVGNRIEPADSKKSEKQTKEDRLDADIRANREQKAIARERIKRQVDARRPR